jgi:hypothetical protein
MPTGIVPAVIAVAILVVIGAGLSWVLAHPEIVAVVLVVIAGTAYLWVRRRRSRNRV